MDLLGAYDRLGSFENALIVAQPLLFWELDQVLFDGEKEIFKREKRHDFVGIFS